ncbi:M23 family metallopeptidase [filamentous cyanobacterium LEGE 11480]|uniref:M23 family metallopeptidase n=2 Tax=Romeriopsis TaxID=2992131 RepID=A0A928Z1R2_9CYAN|nr:M23 family metallopeptidase [Romeriopsis navalis LEGE 11480]
MRKLPQPLRHWVTWYLRLPLWLTGLTALCLVSSAIVLSQQPGAAQLPPISPTRIAAATVSPQKPKLGDTIKVTVPASGVTTSPSVAWKGKTYPMFQVNRDRYRALIPTTPIDKPGRMTLQVNTGSTQNITLNLRNRRFPTQRIWLPAGQDGSVSDDEFDRVNAFKQIVTPEKRWNGKLRRPNNGPVTSIYGVRRYYNGVFAGDYFHRGVDYAGNRGSAVIAPAGAKVAAIGYERNGFAVHGNWVGLDHGQGVTSIYIHLNRITVKPGDIVKAGQRIGTIGNTGSATGPHLHWGFFVHGKAVDPVPWRYKGFE